MKLEIRPSKEGNIARLIRTTDAKIQRREYASLSLLFLTCWIMNIRKIILIIIEMKLILGIFKLIVNS